MLFTSIIFFNIVNGRLIFRAPIERRVLLAAATGVLGVALLFLPELRAALHNPTIVHGAVLALTATYVASLGNMAASRNTSRRFSMGNRAAVARQARASPLLRAATASACSVA